MQAPASVDRSVESYLQMYEIRKVEELILDIFSKGLVMGTTHTCIGQESTAVGVVNALNKDKDFIFSNHRGHGHFLAYCQDVKGLLLEIMGKQEGICEGVGGSQHLHYKNFYSSGVQGGLVPVALGVGFAEKHNGSDAVAVVFLGDGTMGEGIVYEGMNMAALWNLPIVFVVEDNKYAQSTPSKNQYSGELRTRADSFGIQSFIARDNSIISIADASHGAVSYVRAHKKPAYLFIPTYRLSPHSKGDDHRDPQELSLMWRQDPLRILRDDLVKQGVAVLESKEQEISKKISDIFRGCHNDKLS